MGRRDAGRTGEGRPLFSKPPVLPYLVERSFNGQPKLEAAVRSLHTQQAAKLCASVSTDHLQFRECLLVEHTPPQAAP